MTPPGISVCGGLQARRLVLAALLALLLPAAGVQAQAFLTWTGTGNNWNNSGRWSGWDSGSMPYGQLQWTGGGDPTSNNNFDPRASAWRLFFNGNTAYSITGNEIGLTDSGASLGGIMSRATGAPNISATVNFRDAGARNMFVSTRVGGSGAGGGGGNLTFGNVIISRGVTGLRLSGEPGAGRIIVTGAITEQDGAKSLIVGRDYNDAVQSSTFVELRGDNAFSGGLTFRAGTLRVGHNNALGSGRLTIDGEGTSARMLASTGATERTLPNDVDLYNNNLALGQLPPSGGSGRLTFTGQWRLGNEAGQTRTLTVHGEHVINGALSGARGLRLAGGGSLQLNGDNTYTGATVLAGARLGGSGTLTSTLQGLGTVAPGEEMPGVLTASAVRGGDGLGFIFELGATSGSADILHLTGEAPFPMPLDGGNTVDVFLDRASVEVGESWVGGFRTAAGEDFAARIRGAHFRFHLLGDGQGTAAFHRGRGYYRLEDWSGDVGIEVGTVASEAGRVTTFTVTDGSALPFYVIEAADRASDYSWSATGPEAWQHNSNRATADFWEWEFTASPNGGSAGQFIGSSTAGAGDINTDGKAFGIYAHPAISPTPSAGVVRRFGQPVLRTGDTISFRMAVNFRNGDKGFSLRNPSGTGQWNFNVANEGYFVRNGPSASTSADDGQQLGGYDANTIFTFTFTQRADRLDWTIERSGGISANLRGQLPVESGRIADVRFYVTATEGNNAANNLYLNDFTFASERRGDAPLTVGERRYPGHVASHLLRFYDPTPSAVTLRTSVDGFTTSFPLTRQADGVWEIDVRTTNLSPGNHRFKFRRDGVFEEGSDRRIYLDNQGRVAKPPAVYLTWQRDPTTTMTVHWYNQEGAQNQVRYRVPGASSWNTLAASTTPLPHSERLIHTAEITGLNPDWVYEFQVDGYDETFNFRTMPASLASRPVTFGIGGDVDYGATAAAMTAAIAAKNPDFLVIGGDHAYEDARPVNFWKWYRYMESWFRNARTPDGRMIPLVVGVGNHEVRNFYSFDNPDFEDTAEWRLRKGAYYYNSFAFPGPEQPYGALDFGRYLSLLITDTEHSAPVITGIDPQTQWLGAALEARRDVQHLFPVHHVPAYTSYRSTNDVTSVRIRRHWVPLYEAAGVKLVFEHHDHTFKRTKPLLGGVEHPDGIRYVGDGLWGIGSRPPNTSRWYIETANEKHHVHLVTLTSTNRTVEAVDTQGNFFGGRLDQPIDGIPASPVAAVSQLSSNAITLSWDSVPRTQKYKVIRSDGREIETSDLTFTDAEWTPENNFTYVVEAINRSGHSANHPMVAAAPKQLWALNHNLPWNVDMAADTDGDGRLNLFEYFHGLNPLAADGVEAVSVEGLSEGWFNARYLRNPAATDVWERVLSTTNLVTGPWLDAGGEFEDLSGPLEGWRRVRVPMEPGVSNIFLRLEVSE